jgi:hypothetical protein
MDNIFRSIQKIRNLLFFYHYITRIRTVLDYKYIGQERAKYQVMKIVKAFCQQVEMITLVNKMEFIHFKYNQWVKIYFNVNMFILVFIL